jgi:putative FmdB family regulatory protein
VPYHDYVCKKCGETTERYFRFSELDEQHKCECGGKLDRQFNFCPYFKGRQKPKSMSRPQIRGMDSGPGGFMSGRTENNGCGSRAQAERLQKKLAANGMSLGGGVFVPGLCRKGIQEDPYAVCHSKEEIVQKAEQLGRCIEGEIEYRPSIHDELFAKAEAPYRCSEKVVQPDVQAEIKRKHGGKVSASKKREITERMIEKHSGNP